MNGAERLVDAAVQAGVGICFANPGTTEMPLVAALDRRPELRAVLGLFEGVCTGAADGYGRMTRRPALTLLHLGPGFANGIANLHNARRAHTPIVNVIGDQATWHLAYDAPLTADIRSLAAPVSRWVHESRRAESLAADLLEALRQATGPPSGVATLIVPADCQWNDAGPPSPPLPASSPGVLDATAAVEGVARRVREAAEPPVLLLGGRALDERGQRAAAAIAAHTKGRVLVETFPARWTRGGALPPLDRLPYFPEQASEALAGAGPVVTAGAPDPVSFFGYPGVPSRTADEARLARLCAPDADGASALEALAEALGAPPCPDASPPPLPAAEPGPLTAGSAGSLLARHLPEQAILVEEAATSALAFYGTSAAAPRHDVLTLTGGAIGQGLPCAVGAALACPDRPVVAFQADGSAQYTLQSLFTMAREQLDVTVLLCSNRAYRILQVELARAGVAEPGRPASSLMSLDAPALDWVSLARGYGVPGERIETSEALDDALPKALAAAGPRLLELVL